MKKSKKTKNLKKQEEKKFQTPKWYFTGGMEKYKKTFLENLTILLSAGMDVVSALESVEEEFVSRRMRFFVRQMKMKVNNGSSLWLAMKETKIFPPRVISLVKIGEESGRLVKNLNTVVEQQEKEWSFKTKIRTAMLYPAIVLPLTFFVSLGISWFALPKLATVFGEFNAELPLLTRILMNFGKFLDLYGIYVVPMLIFSFIILVYFLFSFPKTKAVGQILLAKMPIFSRLIREVELARFGYVLSGLLQAGIPIVESIDSLQGSTTFFSYRKFYKFLLKDIEKGNSLKKSFAHYGGSENFIPKSIQSMIVSGEESGKLSEILEKIGHVYEIKIETSIKNISVILEPVLLIIIGIAVGAIALAVFMPIYTLTNFL